MLCGTVREPPMARRCYHYLTHRHPITTVTVPRNLRKIREYPLDIISTMKYLRQLATIFYSVAIISPVKTNDESICVKEKRTFLRGFHLSG